MLFVVARWQPVQEVDRSGNVYACFWWPSSPSRSNYVLKRTSIDGEDQFGKTAVEIIQDNFCVDDLLKSLNNEREAIKLIKNVKAIRA